MKTVLNYAAPEIVVCEVAAEQGFGGSGVQLDNFTSTTDEFVIG